jgi:YihY family inner membrane protein
MAGGLAYGALFAIVPAVVLASGVIGLAISDPSQRAATVAVISSVLPPMRDLVATILDEADRNAAPLGLIGAGTLAWSASRFVLSLTDTVSRVMGRTRRRGALLSNLTSLGAVLLLMAAIVVGPALAGLASFADAAEEVGLASLLGPVVRLLLGFVPPAVAILASAFVYRVVPMPKPDWRALALPAILVGVALTILLEAFVFLAPRLIGAAALLGTIATVFAALAWLSLSFQAFLLGAAWVADREPTPTTPGG